MQQADAHPYRPTFRPQEDPLRAAADSAHSRAFNPSRRSHLTLPMNRTVQMIMNTSHKAKYQ